MSTDLNICHVWIVNNSGTQKWQNNRHLRGRFTEPAKSSVMDEANDFLLPLICSKNIRQCASLHVILPDVRRWSDSSVWTRNNVTDGENLPHRSAGLQDFQLWNLADLSGKVCETKQQSLLYTEYTPATSLVASGCWIAQGPGRRYKSSSSFFEKQVATVSGRAFFLLLNGFGKVYLKMCHVQCPVLLPKWCYW